VHFFILSLILNSLADYVLTAIQTISAIQLNDMHTLYKLLERLDEAKIHYTLARYREDMVMVCITVPGKRLEVEVSSEGEVETSMFSGSESIIGGIDIVDKAIKENTD
jgi:hypothetical protein